MEELYIDGNKVKVTVFDSLPSTNTYLKNEYTKGMSNYRTVIAACQTGGRGRLGRSFYSANGGLYMSFLLSDVSELDIISITAIAGISVSEAIDDLYNVKCGIKWVNDLIYNGKKVCGILAEGIISDDGKIQGIVIGIGVNIAPPENSFPDELRDIAGAISDHYTVEDRNNLAFLILKRFNDNLKSKDTVNKYRQLSTVIGKEITVITVNERYNARVDDIDDSFGLVITKNNGEKMTLRSGEISIRTK